MLYITQPEASEQWRVKRDLGVYKEQKIMDEWQKINDKLGKKKNIYTGSIEARKTFFL